MTYEFHINGHKFYVESENHSYRKRFYAIEIVPTGEFVTNGLGEQCEKTEWIRHGYIGSYYPSNKNKSCGFKFSDKIANGREGQEFSAHSTGPKNAAQQCLVAFVASTPVEVS